MKGRRHTPEQVVRKLREADRLLAEGSDLQDVCRQLGAGVVRPAVVSRVVCSETLPLPPKTTSEMTRATTKSRPSH